MASIWSCHGTHWSAGHLIERELPEVRVALGNRGIRKDVLGFIGRVRLLTSLAHVNRG